MRIIMSVSICLVVSMTAEARSGLKKILSEGEPVTCSDVSGLWEGECIEEGKARSAKLQVFQDGCTDIAFYDFDSPIPQVYKIGREGRVVNTRLADTFGNSTTYANWSEDRKTFKASVLANAEFTLANKVRMAKFEETFTVTIKSNTIETIVKGETTSSDGSKEGYVTTCSYRRAY